MLEFPYNSNVYYVVRYIIVEECGITLGDKNHYGMINHFHQIIFKGDEYKKFTKIEPKIEAILENQQLFEKIAFEQQLKQREKDEVKQEYYKDKAIKVFTTKRDLAEKFIQIQPLYYDRSKMWWIWNHKNICWDLTDETDILNMINEHSLVQTTRPAEKAEILEALRQVGRQNKPKELEKTWVQFKSKIVDITTGGTFDAKPTYFAVNPIPHELGDTEDTPVIDRLFTEWVGEEHSKTLVEICAYCLLPDYPLQHIFFFWGSGCNGKSKFLKFIKNFVGEFNCTSVNFDTLTRSQFGTFSLYKKLVCQIGETEFGAKGQTTMLKNLSGDDMIRFEAKGKDGFNAYNYAKLLVATNHLPDVKDKSDGWYRRSIAIKFPNQFPEGRCPLKEITDEEMQNFANKCQRILRELLKKGVFSNVGTIKERRDNYDKASNPFDAFMAESYEITGDDENDRVPLEVFRKEYYDYLVTRGFNTIHASNVQVRKKMDELNIRQGRPWFEGLPYLGEGIRQKKTAWMGLRPRKVGQVGQVGQVLSSQTTRIEPTEIGVSGLSNLSKTETEIILNFVKAKKSVSRDDLEIIAKSVVIDELLKKGLIFEPKVGIYEVVQR